MPKERLNGVNKDRHHPQPVCGLHGERPQGRQNPPLTDDFRFTSPYDDEIDKATYFERCWRATDWIERQDLETIMVEGEAAYVTLPVRRQGWQEFPQHRVLRL